jgi:hypothetical protein
VRRPISESPGYEVSATVLHFPEKTIRLLRALLYILRRGDSRPSVSLAADQTLDVGADGWIVVSPTLLQVAEELLGGAVQS